MIKIPKDLNLDLFYPEVKAHITFTKEHTQGHIITPMLIPMRRQEVRKGTPMEFILKEELESVPVYPNINIDMIRRETIKCKITKVKRRYPKMDVYVEQI